MYNDARATDQLPLIRQHAPANSPVHNASSTLAKLLWCEQQGLLDNAHHILHQCDWVLGKFSGNFGQSDVNNCIKLGYDAEQHRWPEWLELLSIPMSRLPTVAAPGQVIGTIQPLVANELALPETINICAGTTDSTAAVIATGIRKTGEAVTSLGSTLVIKVLSDSPISSAGHGVYSQPLFDNWLVGGASNSGGNVLRHYFSQEQLDAMTPALAPDHPTGLNYYPLVNPGERFPVNDDRLAPQLQPRPEDDIEFFQAILEGISEIERKGYQLLANLGAPYPEKIVTVGGGANNPHWQTIREHLLNKKCLNTTVSKAEHLQAAYGTALLARLNFAEQ